MKSPVIIKSFQDGLSIILDDRLPFEQLLYEVKTKFSESAGFFRRSRMVICFEGRELTGREEVELVHAIEEVTELNILCILGKDPKREELFRQMAEQSMPKEKKPEGQFYKGTLRNGQTLEVDCSIIILGDVLKGAKVVSTGNIIVLGKLLGAAYAGGNGNENHFIAALAMEPLQLRIGDSFVNYPEKKKSKWMKTKEIPKIAYTEMGKINIEPITKELLNDIPL